MTIRGDTIKKLITLSMIGVVILGVVMLSGCIDGSNSTNSETATPAVKLINCKGQGSMPQLLSTGELDAVIAWQPKPAELENNNIGKIVTYSEDLPPKGMWENHPCCVMVISDDALENKNYASKEFLKLIILATEEINRNKTLAVDASAHWLGVEKDIEEKSIPYIKYSADPKLVEDGVLDFVMVMNSQNALVNKLNTTDKEKILNTLFDFKTYNEVINNLNSKNSVNAPSEIPTLKIAYLPTDHHATLFVAATNPELFKNKYGLYLKEIEPKKKYELYEQGRKIADIELVLVSEGGAKIMTLMAQNQIDVGFNGVPPAVFSIDKGTKGKIVCALNNEGSAVVVRKDIPVNNWDEFITWIKEQQKEGKVVKIGHPLPVSIQYVMIKSALGSENITYAE
ncbi:ABC transporter substrate-binding protein [Methanothermococcus sp. SCGC AD-155-M21]|nr:ABC transporter substrate-binding protein [Methanothermococcus sp. SCGC AD-155-M21]